MYYRIKPVTRRRKRVGDKTYHYLYEVESFRRKSKVHQRTRRFVGKLLKLPATKSEYPFKRFIENGKKPVWWLMKDIIAFNLLERGFIRVNENTYVLDTIRVNLRNKEVADTKTGKPVYLHVNGGFLGTETLQQLFKFRFSELRDVIEFCRCVTYTGLFDFDVADPEQSELDKLITVMEEYIDGTSSKTPSTSQMMLKMLMQKYPSVKRLNEPAMTLEAFKEQVGY